MDLKQFLERFNKEDKLMQSDIKSEDQTVYRENIRNTLVDKLGLPENWKMSLADEKKYIQDGPMNLTMGSLGAVSKGLGRVMGGAGKPIKNISHKVIKEAAEPELAALRLKKSEMPPSAYDNQKQQIFNKVRKLLSGE